MKDTIIKGTGNSRTLKSVPNFLTLYPDYQSFAAALAAGTLPVDLGGLNSVGVQQRGTDLNKASLLQDATATKLGLSGDATVDGAFMSLTNSPATLRTTKIITLTESTTWTVPDNIYHNKITVICVGGGGSGGSNGIYANSRQGGRGGGGGSGYVEIREIKSISPGQSIDVVIGAGAAATPLNTSGVDGGDGGSTHFGTFLSVDGGHGGKAGGPGLSDGGGRGGDGGDGEAGGGGGTVGSGNSGKSPAGNGGNGRKYGGGGAGGWVNSSHMGIAGKGGDTLFGTGLPAVGYEGGSGADGIGFELYSTNPYLFFPLISPNQSYLIEKEATGGGGRGYGGSVKAEGTGYRGGCGVGVTGHKGTGGGGFSVNEYGAGGEGGNTSTNGEAGKSGVCIIIYEEDTLPPNIERS